MSIKLRIKKNNNILNYNIHNFYFWNIGLINFIKNSKLIILLLKKNTKKTITFNLKRKINTKINLNTKFNFVNNYNYSDFCIKKNICSFNIQSFKYIKNNNYLSIYILQKILKYNKLKNLNLIYNYNLCFNLDFLNFQNNYYNFIYDINYNNNKLNINFIILNLIYKFENLNKCLSVNNLSFIPKYTAFNLVDIHNKKVKYWSNNLLLNIFNSNGNNFLIKNILTNKYVSFNISNFFNYLKDKKVINNNININKNNNNLLLFNSFNLKFKLSSYLNLLFKYNKINLSYVKKILSFSKYMVKKIVKARKQRRKLRLKKKKKIVFNKRWKKFNLFVNKSNKSLIFGISNNINSFSLQLKSFKYKNKKKFWYYFNKYKLYFYSLKFKKFKKPTILIKNSNTFYSSKNFSFNLDYPLIKWRLLLGMNLKYYKNLNFYYILNQKIKNYKNTRFPFKYIYMFLKLCILFKKNQKNYKNINIFKIKQITFLLKNVMLKRNFISNTFNILINKFNKSNLYVPKKFMLYRQALLSNKYSLNFYLYNILNTYFIKYKYLSLNATYFNNFKKLLLNIETHNNNFLKLYNQNKQMCVFLFNKHKYKNNQNLYTNNFNSYYFNSLWLWYLLFNINNTNLFIKYKNEFNYKNFDKFFYTDDTISVFNDLNLKQLYFLNDQFFLHKHYFSFISSIFYKFLLKKNKNLYLKLYWFNLLYSQRKINMRWFFKKYKQNKKKKYKKKYMYINTVLYKCKHYNYYFRKNKVKKLNKNMFSSFKLFKDLKKKKEYILKNFIMILVNIQFNNTFVTATDLYGNVLVKACAGILGIKGPKRSTPVATEEITNFVCHFVKKNNFKFVLVKLNGILHTRKMKSAVKAISIYKFIILRALNITPKAHNGIKLKKRKRL